MSAYVCMHNRTYSCIIELAMRRETITNPDLLAQRLYLLNVESVNQRYQWKETAPDEYNGYMEHLADIRFEPQTELHDAQRIMAAHCWMYQTCEGDCDQDPLFKAVRSICDRAEIDCAKSIAKGLGIEYDPDKDDKKPYDVCRSYIDRNSLESTWE